MPIARGADAPGFDLDGVRVTALASPSRGAAETILYRVEMDAGAVLPRHRHDHEEVFHVLGGSVTAVLGDERTDLGTGDTVMIPAGTMHHSEAGDLPVVLVVAMRAGTLLITPEGEQRIPPWGE